MNRDKLWDSALRALAAVALASMALGAILNVSYAWDVWYYHLPFAARLWGIVPADRYVFHDVNQARFEGFPLLGEFLQGFFWRVTGRPESANLLAFGSVPLLAWFLRRRLGVPMHFGVIALLAIPLVQTHASSCYVDLPANAAASALLLLAVHAWASPDPVDHRTVLAAALAGGVAANMKTLLLPIVLLGLTAIVARILFAPRRERSLLMVVVVALLLPLVFLTASKNAIVHGNPLYPVQLSFLGRNLPGVTTPYAYAPPWLESSARPVRFACSLLEIGIRPLTDPRRWTVDQWMPPDSTGSRLGGFFGAYVVVELAILAWRVARERARPVRVAAAGFAILTVITALMPQSHELRYYLYWMMVLVSLNLWLAFRPGALHEPFGPRGVAAVSVITFGMVLCVTRAGYAYPSGSTFRELLRDKVDQATLGSVHDGDRVCVRREPFNLLWAAPFHPPRNYVVREAEVPEDCDGFRPLD